MNKYIRGLTLAGLVLAAGCAGMPIPSDYYPGIVKELAPRKGIMVINGCAYRDEVGEDFVITSVSEAHSALWDKTVVPYLAGYGLPLSAPAIRMTCAGYKVAPKEKIFFIPSKDEVAKATPAVLPQVVSTEPLEAETAQNLSAVLQEVHGFEVTIMKSTQQGKKATPSRPKLKLAQEKIQQLRAATGADYIWFVSTLENDVSAGKAVGTAVLTALLTMGTVATMPTGGRQNTVALVNLTDSTMAWKKIEGNAYGATTTQATGAGTTQTTSSGATSNVGTDQIIAAQLFTPFLPIGEGLAGKGLEQQPAPAAEETAAPAAAAPVSSAQ
ncbi:MAG: hypothetical protein ACRES8_08995 [Nevskiaceae bacterium]